MLMTIIFWKEHEKAIPMVPISTVHIAGCMSLEMQVACRKLIMYPGPFT